MSTVRAIVLHFHGPLQSWAGPSLVKTRVDTNKEPSVGAIKGLLHGVCGVPRGERLELVENSTVLVETLKPGRLVRDFQTISSRGDESFFAERVGRILEKGKGRGGSFVSPNDATMVVNRTYLGDAAFLVAVDGGSPTATQELYDRLLSPHWSPYLGRRSFPPTFPFILGVLEGENKNEVFSEAKLRLEAIEAYECS